MISDIIEAFISALAPVAAVRFGPFEAARLVQPPALAVEVTSASTVGVRAPGGGVGRARPIFDDVWTLTISAWGVTFRQAERVRQAALTALRAVATPGALVPVLTEVVSHTALTRGVLLVTTIDVRVPVVEASWRATVGSADAISDAIQVLANAAGVVEVV